MNTSEVVITVAPLCGRHTVEVCNTTIVSLLSDFGSRPVIYRPLVNRNYWRSHMLPYMVPVVPTAHTEWSRHSNIPRYRRPISGTKEIHENTSYCRILLHRSLLWTRRGIARITTSIGHGLHNWVV